MGAFMMVLFPLVYLAIVVFLIRKVITAVDYLGGIEARLREIRDRLPSP